VPGIYENFNEATDFSKIRNIDMEELLGGSQIQADSELLTHCCKDSTVLITGAAGIIGSQISNTIAQYAPKI
jgi:FlaA1/EpsC-like NDP-sugar epimerase